VFACVNACRKFIYFIYLGNKELYWIFKASCIIRQSVLFSTKLNLFHILSSYVERIWFSETKHQNLNTHPIIFYCIHHASWFTSMDVQNFALIVSKTWPTTAGWRLILSHQCWILPSDLSSLPSTPIRRHSTSDTARSMSSASSSKFTLFLMFQNNYLNSPCIWRATVHFSNTKIWGTDPRIQSMQGRSASYFSHTNVYCCPWQDALF